MRGRSKNTDSPIYKARSMCSMTLEELASQTGISYHTLRRIEDGKLRHLRPDVAKRIAIVTGVDAKELMNGQAIAAKKINRDWTPRLDSAKIVFAALVDELLDVEAYLGAQDAFYEAAAVLSDKTATEENKEKARARQGEAAKTMDEADRSRGLFYYLFGEWAAKIAEQFELNGQLRLLDLINRIAELTPTGWLARN